ncbi:SufS family cysteine desulfurase [Marinobacterium rhizophilum]|uniref:SufS family cysteine desulfurase n=1 Tax=Marinobacterium rhizophilum TaxID=420402 RepID=UPI0003720A06|nr:SufS family cysteine desulfurase [Marinobacterium rhizophilum]
MLDIAHLRADFPILGEQVHNQPLIYFDNAATTQKPQVVIDAQSQYYCHSNANVHRASHSLSSRATRAFERARENVARFIGAASPREIIWTRGATEAINLVAHSYGRSQLSAGDLILVSALEHHANIVPWQLLAQQLGARLKAIPLLDDGSLDQAAYLRLLEERPRLVALTHASNALGTLNPVAEMTRAAQAAGARVLIDGAQSTPHLPIDVQAIGCDFFVFSGHKLFGPTGIGALWARESLLEAMPPWQAGGEMIEHVSFEATRFAGLPFKFEAGTPNIAGVIGLDAAIGYLQQFDREALEAHEMQLLHRALELCSDIPGFRPVGQAAQRVSVMSFCVDGLHQQDLGLMLDQYGIAVRAGHHCAMPLMQRLGLPGTLRASFAFYNSQAEVERFACVLREIVQEHNRQPPQDNSTPLQSETQSTPPVAADTLLQRLENCRGWQARYREIMLLGKNLPAMSAALRTDSNRLHGCESHVWLCVERRDGKLWLQMDSDARVIRGLIALLLAAFNGKTANDILSFDLQGQFERLKLIQHLSPSRGNGLKAIVDAIYQHARQQQDNDQAW